MAKSDNAATIAAVAAKVQTVGQARAALGKAADLLREGYDRAEEIGSSGNFLTSNTIEFFMTSDTREAARARLDVVNAYATGIYATLPTAETAQGNLLEFLQSQRTALALSQAQGALKDIETAAAIDYWNIAEILTDAIEFAAKWVGQGVQAVTNAVGRAAVAFTFAAWPTLLIVGAVAGLYIWWRFFRRRSS
jgi:hypothetical protein